MNARQLKDLDQCVILDAQGISKNCDTCSCRVCLSQEAKLLYEASVGRAALKAFKMSNGAVCLGPVDELGHYEIGLKSPEQLLEWAEKESEA